MNRKQFEALVERKYIEIGHVIAPDMSLESPNDVFESLIAGQAALHLSLAGNISALTTSGLIPADLGRELELTATQLSTDMQKAMKAQQILDSDSRVKLKDKVVH